VVGEEVPVPIEDALDSTEEELAEGSEKISLIPLDKRVETLEALFMFENEIEEYII
jgi:hypothetical protein